jgi:hypothetical protein
MVEERELFGMTCHQFSMQQHFIYEMEEVINITKET